MNGMKRLAVILLALILGAVCAYGIEQALYTAATGNVATDTAGATIYGPSVQRVMQSDCTLVDGAYTITGDEPWFGLSNGNYKTSNIKIQLKTPAESGFYYKIYFAGADLEFSESNTVQGNAAPGTQTLTLEIPQGVYASLRFYFDTDLQIESIESGGEIFAPNWLRAALVCVGIALLFSLLVFLIQKKRQPKTLLRALAIALALAVLLDLGIYLFSGRSLVYRQEDVVDTLDPMDGTTYNYKYVDGFLTPTAKESLLWIYPDEYEIQGLLFHCSKPTTKTIEAQIFYMTSEAGLSATDSVTCSIPKGVYTAGVNIPANVYSAFLFIFKQPIPIESITVSESPVDISYKNYAFSGRTAIQMAGCAALILLFYGLGFVQKGFWAVYGALFSPKTRFPAVDAIYAALLAFMVLFHLYVTATFPDIGTTSEILYSIWYVMAAVGILLAQAWKDKGFWILAALLLLKFLRLFIPSPELVIGSKVTFYSGIFAFFICYTAARAIRSGMHTYFLKTLCGLWTLAEAGICCLGIYAAWTGQLISNFSTSYFGIAKYQRLELVHYVTMTAGIISLSIAVALFGIVLSSHKWTKTLYALSIIPMLIASGLTGTRTAYITVGFGVSVFTVVLLYNQMCKHKEKQQRIKTKEFLLLSSVFIILFGGIVLTQVFTIDGFNAVKDSKGLVLPHAYAESEAVLNVDAAHRGFESDSVDSLLSRRVTIWKAAIENLIRTPSKLLFGESVLKPMRNVNVIIPSKTVFGHCHNILLQTTLENGIPGLLLLLAFLIPLVIQSWKVLFNRSLALWQRMLPLPAIVILLGETVECLTILENGLPSMSFFYLFAGFTMAVSSSKGCIRRKK